MGIHHDARLAEGIAEDQVGGLAANAWQSDKLLQRVRNFPAEAIAQRSAEADERLRFGTEIACRLDDLLDIGLVRGGVVGGCAIPGEQHPGYLVDPPVRGLGGQDRRNQQFERRREIELDTRIRVQAGQITVAPACSPYPPRPRRDSLGHPSRLNAAPSRLIAPVISVQYATTETARP